MAIAWSAADLDRATCDGRMRVSMFSAPGGSELANARRGWMFQERCSCGMPIFVC
jgi:hypothetical protein